MFPQNCLDAAAALLRQCQDRQLRLAAAESCTGGLVLACLTELAGSSSVVDRGWIVYDNRAKVAMLGVRDDTLVEHGAVSERCAREMAEGALGRSDCSIALAVTGIAGPGGGSEQKPVGLVHIAAALAGGPTLHERHVFSGDRQAVRLASVEAALRLGLRLLAGSPAIA